jgi:hypothetical protein
MEHLMRHIVLLTGAFILAVLPTEGIMALMEEVRPSVRPEVREEAEMPLTPAPQEEEAPLRFSPPEKETELPLKSPLEELTPSPLLLETAPPETYHKKLHKKANPPREPASSLPSLQKQIQDLCQKRSESDLNNHAITKACKALGCSHKHPAQPCHLKKK